MRIRPNCPGVTKKSGFGEGRAGADRPGAAIDLIVDEVELALARPVRLVGQAHVDRRAVARLVELAGGGGALIGEIVALAHVEIEVDRVERHDRGEHRGRGAVAAADQVADAHLMVADAPGERRGDLGELDIELGRADRRLGGFDARPSRPGSARRAGRRCWPARNPSCAAPGAARAGDWRGRPGHSPGRAAPGPRRASPRRAAGSMTNSRSPSLTICPSSKWISVR